MSKNEGRASEKGLDELESDSVFDFLYCDSERIGSFLAQFDDSGLLEKVIQRESATKGAKRGVEFSLGGGAMLAGTGGTGNIGIKRGPTEEGSEASERVYNPLWVNARTFLDYLAERDLIAGDVMHAGIGQFVKISGILKVIDLTIIKKIIENPILAKALAAASDAAVNAHHQGTSRAERRRNEAITHSAPLKSPSQAETGMALASLFGMTTQAIILNRDVSAWCTLRDQNLIVSAADLLLQHGLLIAGEWTTIGILDAKPGRSVDASTIEGESTPLVNALTHMIPAVRNLVGRPDAYFGVTPLLILRQIVG